MSGLRFSPGNLVWLWSPVVEKGVAPKFHEPWTGPYKVTKRLSDITYEIHDEAKNKTKIVHFDRLKKATLSPVKLINSDNEALESSETESESDFEDVVARRQHVPRHGDAPGVVHVGIPRPSYLRHKLPLRPSLLHLRPSSAPGAQHRPADQHQAPAAPATAAKQARRRGSSSR